MCMRTCMNIPRPLEHPMHAHTLTLSLAADIGKASLFLGDIQQTGAAWPLKKGVCTYDCTQCQYECKVKAQNTYQYLTLLFLLYCFIVLRRRLSTNVCGSTTRHLPPSLFRSCGLVRLIFGAVRRTFSFSLNPLTAGV